MYIHVSGGPLDVSENSTAPGFTAIPIVTAVLVDIPNSLSVTEQTQELLLRCDFSDSPHTDRLYNVQWYVDHKLIRTFTSVRGPPNTDMFANATGLAEGFLNEMFPNGFLGRDVSATKRQYAAICLLKHSLMLLLPLIALVALL